MGLHGNQLHGGTGSGYLYASAGSLSAPSISFFTDTNTGFYSYADNAIGVSTGGNLTAIIVNGGGIQTEYITPITAVSLKLRGRVADGATSDAVLIANQNSLTTAGSNICVFYSDSLTTERAAVDRLGRYSSSQNSTGAGSALLGANCPASTVANPYTWIHFVAADGTVVYVPAWA
jgi:hypothetical protein